MGAITDLILTAVIFIVLTFTVFFPNMNNKQQELIKLNYTPTLNGMLYNVTSTGYTLIKVTDRTELRGVQTGEIKVVNLPDEYIGKDPVGDKLSIVDLQKIFGKNAFSYKGDNGKLYISN